MIISDTHKFIFIAIPKTGTHSVREVLTEYATDYHVGTGGGVSIPHKSRFPEFANFHHGHLTASQMNSVVNIADYYTFCVFRNPYSRAVSLWSFYTKHQNPKPNILEFFKNEGVYSRILFKPQSYFITNSEGFLLVDYIIKFENYQNGLNHVLNQLQIPIKNLSVINSSEHDDFQKYYKEYPELEKIIRDKYSSDFKIWEGL